MLGVTPSKSAISLCRNPIASLSFASVVASFDALIILPKTYSNAYRYAITILPVCLSDV
jgi:hypothetical protein